ALVSTCQQTPSLRRGPLGNEPLLALVPEAHSLAKKAFVELDDLKAQRFLLLHEMHCLSQQVHHLLEARRLRPEIALAGSQLSTIANMVAAGIGVSIVPQMMVKQQAAPGCVSLPFRSEEHTSELQSRVELVCRIVPVNLVSFPLSLHDALPISRCIASRNRCIICLRLAGSGRRSR